MINLQLILHFYLISLLFFGITLAISFFRENKELKIRVLTLLGLLHLICLALTQGIFGWGLFTMSILSIGIYEVYKSYPLTKKRSIFYIISNIILIIAGTLTQTDFIELSIPALILMIITVFRYDEVRMKNCIFPIAFSSCFLIPCSILLIDIFRISPGAIIAILLLLQVNDSFGYLFGKKWGKTYLFPNISPNKSLEGYCLGSIGIILGLVFLHTYIPVLEFDILKDLTLYLTIFLFGNMGDLFFSWIKRKLDIKDFSQLLPGHGGVLDRFDNTVFIAPFFHFFISHHLIF